MAEEEKSGMLKRKVSEVKQRLGDIYSQSFSDAAKGKLFESEFSLYLRAGEYARKEILEGIRLRHDITRLGLSVLIVSSLITVYLFTMHVFLGMLILLSFGLSACGFMLMLMVVDIRTTRAEGYCRELATYFKQHRWLTEQDDKMHLPDLPLWEEYRDAWDNDVFNEGRYEKTALYAPFRISVTLIDLLALAYVMHAALLREPRMSWIVLALYCIIWIMAVVVQMLLVDSVITRVSDKVHGADKDRTEYSGRREITLRPRTWITVLRHFLMLDVIFPSPKGRRAD